MPAKVGRELALPLIRLDESPILLHAGVSGGHLGAPTLYLAVTRDHSLLLPAQGQSGLDKIEDLNEIQSLIR